MRQSSLHKDITGPLSEGLQAYAANQADMEWQIHKAWLAKWSCARELAQSIIKAVMGEVSVSARDTKVRVIEFKIEED